MKRYSHKTAILIFILLILLIFPICVSAHSGRTDSKGGHKDNKNKSGLGSYHYHCGGYPAHLHKDGYCPYRDVFPSSVSFDLEQTTLRKGEKITFSTAVYPSNSCNTHVHVYCDNPDIIKMTDSTLEALDYGTANITAESFNGLTTTITITVKEVVADYVEITTETNLEEPIYIGDQIDFQASITPSDVDNPKIIWTSSDESIATVDNAGTVKTLKDGCVTISAVTSNDITDEITLNVQEKYVENIELSHESLTLLLGSTENLTATITPNDATFPEITWTSSDDNIVSVSKTGEITAVGCGTAEVTATSSNDISVSVDIEVTEIIAEKIEIFLPEKIYIGSITLATVKFYPDNVTIKDIKWESTDESILSVDETGNLFALQDGTVTLTALQKDTIASIDITIYPIDVEQIDILGPTTKIYSGDIITLTANVYPSNATHSQVTWHSDDPEIASVTEDGILKANSYGDVLITARSADGFEQNIVISVSPNLGEIAVFAGGTGTLVAGAVTGIVVFKRKRR